MVDESKSLDIYELFLAELDARAAQIEQLKALVQSLRGTGTTLPEGMVASLGARMGAPTGDTVTPNMFHGLSIVEAAKKLMKARNRDLTNADMVTAFKAGGLVLRSKDAANTINSIMTRDYKGGGDIVRVSRGTWGLADWHPTLRSKSKGDNKKKDAEPARVGKPRVRLVKPIGES